MLFERTRPAASIKPPCLINDSTSTTPRGVFARAGYIIISEIYKPRKPSAVLLFVTLAALLKCSYSYMV